MPARRPPATAADAAAPVRMVTTFQRAAPQGRAAASLHVEELNVR